MGGNADERAGYAEGRLNQRTECKKPKEQMARKEEGSSTTEIQRQEVSLFHLAQVHQQQTMLVAVIVLYSVCS